MKKKGFTLIELLAVIVILAIIGLIAIPVITNVIEKAKVGAAKASASAYIKAVENQIALNAVDLTKEEIRDGEYSIDKLADKGVYVKGNGPTSGNVTIDDSQVTSCNLVIDKYTLTCLENGEIVVGEEDIDEELEQFDGTEIGVITQNLLNNNTYGNYTYMNGTYLKGVQESNYVWYNGFLWRIMGINENGTVRLITEENVATVPYSEYNRGLQYHKQENYLHGWLNNYFLDNLDSKKNNIIKENEWCLNSNNLSVARENCDEGTIFKAKVGMLTLDEFNLSGASKENSTYYLVNSLYYWLLTPYGTYYTWAASASGETKSLYNQSIFPYGVRPIINVRADAIVTSGDGSLNNAYLLNQTNESKTGKLNEKSSSGEYVKLNEKMYRIVSNGEDGTKLIYDGYYEENAGTAYSMTFGEDNTFTTSSGIGQKLNNEVLTWLGDDDKILEATWYQTKGYDNGTAYTTTLGDKTNSVKAKIGLITVGEMLSGQSATILTKNYTVRSTNSLTVKNYWAINKSVDGKEWIVSMDGNAYGSEITSKRVLRPVIILSNDTIITSGNGTFNSPYIIE